MPARPPADGRRPSPPAGGGGLHAQLIKFALTLPGAYEDQPWGEVVAKVNKKIFVFLGSHEPRDCPIFGVKLLDAHEQAMLIPGASPAGYGLGRSGWVSVPLYGEIPDIGTLCDFVEESYRIVAPRRLVSELDGRYPPVVP